MGRFIRRTLTMFLVLAYAVSMLALPAFAANSRNYLHPTIYELPDGSDYSYSGSSAVQTFSYGKRSMGNLYVFGDLTNESTFNGWTAYSTTGDVSFGISYDGSYQTKDKDAWNLESDDGKVVNGISVPKKVKSGVIIVQKSPDKITWENACDPINDFFSDNKSGKDGFYTASETEVMNGIYYRIIIAYTMTHRIDSKSVMYFFSDDEYEQKECVEVYEFYVSSNNNYVTVHDLATGDAIGNNSTTATGFYIKKSGSTDTVVVKNGQTSVTAKNYDFFSKPGKYTVEITTSLGKKYYYTITVSDGQALAELHPSVYESKKNSGFTTDNLVSAGVYGRSSFTTLSLARSSDAEISTSTRGGFDAYGITGKSAAIYLKLRLPGDDMGNGWSLEYDKWGKKEKEQINGIMTGEIGKGAIVVQTSKDGINWTDVEKGRYANGLYSTDFGSYYEANQNVLVYTPAGTDVLNGIYIRVYFAYQVYNKSEKEYKDYVEEYQFYLCSNELGAVTFHNLSVTEQLEEVLGDADDTTVALYKSAETMLSGACTTTGFSIDTSKNPTVTYTVKKNGTTVAIPSNHTFSATGKYDISITSAVGDKRDVTIYVDRNNDEETLALYFGNSFLSGKRIFAEGEYPVYEGGEVNYNISAVPDSFLPISGTITNQSTGSTITIDGTREAKSGVITEAGSYVAEFTTNPGFSGDKSSGDTRVIVFRFSVIPNGTAPGPKVNQNSLSDYSHSSMIDAYPLYYGLTYQSASKGYITLAFATKEAAINFAYEYEKGMVEKQADGSYRYNGAFFVAQKERYDSAWDLTDAVNYFAEQAVQPLYFDASDPFLTLTLAPDVLEKYSNLRTLELQHSVVIFAEGQKEQLTAIDALPIINDKPYSYLNITTGSTIKGTSDFRFVTDRFGGIDSAAVVITDCNGTEYDMSYSRSVGQQLKAKGCPSGIVTITETTKFGDTATYQAIYIAPDDNQTTVTLTCYDGSNTREVIVTKDSTDQGIVADSFAIKDIVDSLDPYALVIVKNRNRTYPYVVGTTVNEIWSDAGEYTITCVNRLGYGYSFTITVSESDNVAISFKGEGTEEIPAILSFNGAKNVALPTITRYGYQLVGFMDSHEQLYTDAIPTITSQGEIELTAVWKASTTSITLLDENGAQIQTMEADYGRTYDLPGYTPKNGGEFLGWSLNGSILEEMKLTVTTEDPISVTASVQGIEIPIEPETESSSGVLPALIGIPVIGILGAGAYLFVKKNTKLKKEEAHENDESNS